MAANTTDGASTKLADKVLANAVQGEIYIGGIFTLPNAITIPGTADF